MQEDRWRRIERLYNEALARPAGERTAFIDAECPLDPDVRLEVLQLLAEADPASAELAAPVIGVARQLSNVRAGALVGRRLGGYELQAFVGAGSMGEVYRALDTKLGRTVAIKILTETFSHDPARLLRFRREASLLAALNHPNIAAIYEFAEADDLHFLVLEYVDGGSLKARLRRGRLPVDEALRIAKQIAAALHAAHDKGIVHRDMKPANVALTSAGQVKVLDFGIAKIAAGPLPDSDTLTAPNVVVGTIGYMSPEQARGNAVGKAGDVWAFGCVLFEMLSGTRAFSTADDPCGQPNVLGGEPDWRLLPNDLAPAIHVLMRRCLSTDLNRRLADVATASFLLDEATSSSELWPHGRGAGTTAPNWILVFAVVGVAALLTTLVTGIALRIRDRRVQPAAEMRFDIHAPGSVRDIVVSPDSHRLAYVTAGTTPSAIWIRPIDALDAQRLDGTEGATGLFWAADSRQLAFFAEGKLKRVDVIAGGVHALCDAAISEPGAWNNDGIILFSAFFGGRASIARISAEGGEIVPVTRVDHNTDFMHLRPQFLQDGRHFLYSAVGGWEQPATLSIASLDSTDTQRVMEVPNFLARGTNLAAAFVPPDTLLYVRDATLMLQRVDPARFTVSGQPIPIASQIESFSASASGMLVYHASTRSANAEPTVSLSWFARTGVPAGAIRTSINVGYIELSPDGRRLAVDDSSGSGHYENPDIWIIDLARRVPLRLTFSPAFEGAPLWSPDGGRIVFGGIQDGHVAKLYEMAATGVGAQRRLFNGDAADVDMPQDWSSDGRYILFQRIRLNEAIVPDLWVLPLDGNAQPSLYLHTGFPKVQAQLSPDGHYVAYSTNESGRYEIVVQTFPSSASGKWLITANGGTEPRWRRDGKELYYLAPDGQLMAVDIRHLPMFTPGEPNPLFHTPLEPQRPMPLSRRYAVSADGQRFLVLVPSPSAKNDAQSTSITVIVNATVLNRGTS